MHTERKKEKIPQKTGSGSANLGTTIEVSCEGCIEWFTNGNLGIACHRLLTENSLKFGYPQYID